ncbi:NAD(P)/FAD-dependent oxidoreductase [Pedobacter endophyticus]|uniref:NAD(P)/FAD-dependent oxidoreductase n=1 Tax=Pedobacter endophyticus TaxID=2789740 RepID=A0A7U3Q530_9SPHI|nr:NAD(P)/FAD-dependent oxidoreductase [Pedobacter endophyticus]QPH38724.1 NAD(P)/FAD-dependent oxidoreductase [Pedobacter endophyticus]
MSKKQTAIIIGAGPGGLTAAFELATRSNIDVTILEASNEIGGISRTVNYKGNRIDIGGHRFFSKSTRVLDWWANTLPLEPASQPLTDLDLSKIGPASTDSEKGDKVMLIRKRVSRIFYLRKFFDYPISLNYAAAKNLGFIRIIKIGIAYITIRLFPIKNEQTLEDFLVNRFGRVLYETFFKDYTEKVWGIPCHQIKPEWGSQRIKGLSISKAIKHSIKSMFEKDETIEQKKIETSLIDKFMYPKFGPGQLWEEVADKVSTLGGKIVFGTRVTKIKWITESQVEVSVKDVASDSELVYTGNYLFSTMPIKDLILGMGDEVPLVIQEVAKGLAYRDFITVGLLLKGLKIKDKMPNKAGQNPDQLISDNWIYIQENDVKLGRLQIFNNWSPYMVADSNNVWLGLEYFCNEGDHLWNMEDRDFITFAIEELVKISFIEPDEVLDSTVIKVPKAYPAYFGSYDDLPLVSEYTDSFSNMFLIGRNGMHKYNNQDHSMLTAMVAVDNLLSGKKDKGNIWIINTENDYHETKTSD